MILLLELSKYCFDLNVDSAFNIFQSQLMQQIRPLVKGNAEDWFLKIYGNDWLNDFYQDPLSILKLTFNLNLRLNTSGKMTHHHRSFFIRIFQPAKSQLVSKLTQAMRQDGIGIKAIENSDPDEIVILGLEGGIHLNELRDMAEFAEEYDRQKTDPTIHPTLKRRRLWK